MLFNETDKIAQNRRRVSDAFGCAQLTAEQFAKLADIVWQDAALYGEGNRHGREVRVAKTSGKFCKPFWLAVVRETNGTGVTMYPVTWDNGYQEGKALRDDLVRGNAILKIADRRGWQVI